MPIYRLITTKAGVPKTRNHEWVRTVLSARIALVVLVRKWDLKLSLPAVLLGSNVATPSRDIASYINLLMSDLSSSIGGLVVKLAVAIRSPSSDNVGQPRVRFPADASNTSPAISSFCFCYLFLLPSSSPSVRPTIL